MTDDRKSSLALIAGSLAGLVTMAIHPTAGSSLAAQQADHLSMVSGIANGLALVGVLLVFLGACGLARSIACGDRLCFAAIVTFGFACIAVFIAATVSGFILPKIMQQMTRDLPSAVSQWKIVISGFFQINQAFSSIYSISASLAIVLWSVSAFRNGGLGRGVAVYGCIVSSLIIVGVSIGHLRLNVHGMALVWVAQAIWFFLAAAQLWKMNGAGPAALIAAELP